ncbi:uncharacterized protein LOC142020868 isoform X2 [Carettochelys insculpta]
MRVAEQKSCAVRALGVLELEVRNLRQDSAAEVEREQREVQQLECRLKESCRLCARKEQLMQRMEEQLQLAQAAVQEKELAMEQRHTEARTLEVWLQQALQEKERSQAACNALQEELQGLRQSLQDSQQQQVVAGERGGGRLLQEHCRAYQDVPQPQPMLQAWNTAPWAVPAAGQGAPARPHRAGPAALWCARQVTKGPQTVWLPRTFSNAAQLPGRAPTAAGCSCWWARAQLPGRAPTAAGCSCWWARAQLPGRAPTAAGCSCWWARAQLPGRAPTAAGCSCWWARAQLPRVEKVRSGGKGLAGTGSLQGSLPLTRHVHSTHCTAA